MYKKVLALFTCLLLLTPILFAQQEIEMADEMRASGKIYIVVGTLVMIFIGIVAYLISIDRKITKLEKEK